MVESLREQVGFLEGANAVLVAANTNLVAEVAAKDAQVAAKEAEVNALKFQLEQLRRMLFGSKRERFVAAEHPSQTRLEFDIDEQVLEAAIEADKQEVTYTREKPRKPHPGRLELPSHLPIVETVIEPETDTTGMKRVGEEVTDELEYTPASLFINRIIRPKYITREDTDGRQKQVIAELDRPIPRCIAGASLLAHVLVMKFVFHMPLYRQLQVFKMEGVHVHTNTLDSWMSLAAAHVRPLYAVHKAYILESNYLQADESTIKVLDRDKPGATHQGYMWVYHSPPQRAVFFEYKRGRGADAPKANLQEFTGFLQTDGYVVYDAYDSKEGVVHLSCWAHARRMFDRALENDRARASHVLALVQQLYDVERVARDGGYTPVQRHELRLERSLPLLNLIGKYIADNRDSVLPQSPIGKAFAYCANRWDNLLNYLKDGILEIDSNLVENAIRPLALGRKNYLFAGSHDAAQNIAMFYSFFASCKKNDINPHKWLEYVIRNINDSKTSQLKNLLPQFIDKSLLV
jgi:transposase